MKAAQTTNHGAALESKPLRQILRDTPVPIREDIARRAREVDPYTREGLPASDRLAVAMRYLSLESAKFGGFGHEGELVDALVKKAVKEHHRAWVMRPLEQLYDELVALEAAEGKGVAG